MASTAATIIAETLRVRERPEQPSCLALERQDRQKRNGNDQQREEARPGDLFDAAKNDRAHVLSPPRRIPFLQPSVRLLDHDDGRVDESPDGQRNPAEGHDVGSHSEPSERV